MGDQYRECDGLYCVFTAFLWKAHELIFMKFIISVIKMNIDTKVNEYNHDQILHQKSCKLMAEVNVCIAEMKSSLSGVLQLMIQLSRSAGLRKRAAGDTSLKSSILNPGHMQGTHLTGRGAEFPQPYLTRRDLIGTVSWSQAHCQWQKLGMVMSALYELSLLGPRAANTVPLSCLNY